MTDIENLRDAVIEAAWEYTQKPDSNNYQWNVLVGNLNALNKKLKPDPWSLLREARKKCYLTDAGADVDKRHFIASVDEALAWKDRNR